MDFDWDPGNRDKNLAHGVSDWEIEEALADIGRRRVRSTRIDGEVRMIVLARCATSGKYLASFTLPACVDHECSFGRSPLCG